MEAAKQINHFTERVRDLEDSLALLKNAKNALDSEGADKIYTFNEVNAAKQALEELILHHPDFRQDIELGLIAVPVREQISALINLKDLKSKLQTEGEAIKKLIGNLENLSQVSLIMLKAKSSDLTVTTIETQGEALAHNEAQNPAPIESPPEAVAANRAQIGSLLNEIPHSNSTVPDGQSAAIVDAVEQALQEEEEKKKEYKPSAPAPLPKPHILDPDEESAVKRANEQQAAEDAAEAEAERKRIEAEEAAEREREKQIERLLAIPSFLMDLGVEPKDKSPVAQAIRSALYKRVKELDVEKLQEFMEDPNSIAKERIGELEEARQKNRDAYNETLGEIEVLTARLSALGNKNKASTEPAPDPKESGRLKSKKARLEEEGKAIKDELEALNKVGPAGEREYNSPESKLIMINYYFAYKDSQKKDKAGKVIGKPVKWKNILEDSHKAIEKSEADEKERRVEWTWKGFLDKVTGLVKPTLESTLEAIAKKDETVGKIDKAHLMKLPEVPGEDQGMAQWIQKLPGEKKEKMETTLPALIAHLEIALNEGNAAHLNTFSQKNTAELLNQMRKAVRDYALSQAKLKEGDTLTKLDTYFEKFNGVMDTKGSISKDIVLGHGRKRIFWNVATPVLAVATDAAAYSALLAVGPLGVLLPVSGFLATYLGAKGFKESNPEKKEKLKRWSFRAALSTALGTAAWGAFGLTSWPVLGIMTVGGVLVPALIKNREIFKKDKTGSVEASVTATAPAVPSTS